MKPLDWGGGIYVPFVILTCKQNSIRRSFRQWIIRSQGDMFLCRPTNDYINNCRRKACFALSNQLLSANLGWLLKVGGLSVFAFAADSKKRVVTHSLSLLESIIRAAYSPVTLGVLPP